MHPHTARNIRPVAPLIALALFAMAIVLIRAALQSATIDEADSYVSFSSLPWPSHWIASPGNHVLNSIIVRFFATVFGPSHLVMRSGALIGAAIYIASAVGLALRFAQTIVIRLALFCCLVFNPFILDYLIAGRGYSLALGFLLAAIALLSAELTNTESLAYLRLAFASVCLGLCFSASFPFAYIIGPMLIVFVALTRRRQGASLARLAGVCFLPALMVVIAVSGSTASHFTKEHLFFGAKTVHEMWHSLVSSSLYQLNPHVVNPLLFPWLHHLGERLPLAFYVSLLLMALAAAIVSWRNADRPAAATVCVLLAFSIASAFSLNWIAHRMLRIPLLMERTAVFFVPLATLLFGLLVEFRYGSWFGKIIRSLGALTLVAGSIYFLGCLRLSHFKQWDFDAETQLAFRKAQEIARANGIREIVTGWPYTAAFKFYDLYYGKTSVAPLVDLNERATPEVTGSQLFVLSSDNNSDFIAEHQLRIVLKGEISDLVIAIPVASKVTP